MVLVTSRYLKGLRQYLWERKIGIGTNPNMMIDSKDALPENLQDYQTPMVLCGSDVVSLYPNMEVDRVAENIKEAVLGSNMKWEEFDYMEGARYLALNWTAEECYRSKLRRVLPTRRGRRGTRPGLRGAGPRGRVKGDQEQWEFPPVILDEWEKKEIIAEVVSLAVKAMFRHHYYHFGGDIYHQAQGGPIGLRGTCAIARVIMNLFDSKWKKRLENLGIRTWLIMRYVDDSRAALPPLKPGWRWQEETKNIMYTKEWAQEDDLTAEGRTRDILGKTMEGIEDYLSFTVESGEQFGGWLPTLDTSMKVTEDNRIVSKFFEKDTTKDNTVQKDSAMEENSKIKILSNDLIRRLTNTMECLGHAERDLVVDGYGQKLLNSGYDIHQTRSILIKGIKGYEGRKLRCQKEGRKLRRTAQEGRGMRSRKKLLDKVNWYRKKPKEDLYEKKHGKKRRQEDARNKDEPERPQAKSVLFIEQTNQGELGKRLRELLTRITPILGFSIKIVERTGASLGSKFPQASLWDDQECGRSSCITCHQGGEKKVPCTRKSLVYENICVTCNPGARGKDEVKNNDPDTPSIYVGETSRTIQERLSEHWAAFRGGPKAKEGSHIFKHQQLHHGGNPPNFILKAVEFHKTALARQTGEAVRIQRRGGEGAVLNSRGEFNRSYIPRLRLADEEVAKEIEENERSSEEMIRNELQKQEESWKSRKTMSRTSTTKFTSRKAWKKKHDHGIDQETRPSKRRKFSLVVGWGEEREDDPGQAKTTSIDLPSITSSSLREGEQNQEPKEGSKRRGSSGTPEKEHNVMEGHPLPPTKEGDHPQNLRNSQEYEDNYRSLNDGGNILSLPGNLRNSQEYEEEQNALAGGNTNTGRNLRNSQEYEGLPPAMEGGNTNMGKTLRNSQEYEEVDKEYGRPGEESFLTRGVQEQQHTLPTELTNVVGKEGLMVLEKENSKPAEQLNDIAEEGEYENEVVKNLGRDEDSGGVDDGDEQKMRCIIENKRCTVHQCETRGVKVSSKVWVWQPKKHQYGYAPRKTTKYICMHRIAGQRAPSVTNSKTDSGPLYSGGEVGRFSENITIIPDTRGQTDYMSERTGFT